jgi:Cys-tRNA(Pro)/Cys-tRNA(Cys) deacylase
MARSSDASHGTPATVALLRAGIAFTAHSYVHDETVSGYGHEAAEALGVDPERVFKTLVADGDGSLVVAIVPVSGQLNLKGLAAAAGFKRAKLADPAVAERKTGYVLGGISPIGQKTALRTVLDDTAQRFETVYVSGGRRGFDVELAPADLLTITRGSYAPIGR